MIDMVERVARAIARASNDDPDGLTGSLLNEDERYWQHYVKQARAAIEAMREPTKDMRSAAAYYLGQTIDISELYSAMIDAALGKVTA